MKYSQMKRFLMEHKDSMKPPYISTLDGILVIVMSYNATKIRYLDPVTGKSTAASRTDVTNRLEKSGKVFYSYIAD